MQYSAAEFICFLLQSGGFHPLDSRILPVSWLSVRGFAEANVRCGTVLPWPETSFLPMSGFRSDRRCLDPVAQRTLFSLSVPFSCCNRVERHEGNDAFDRFFRCYAWVLFCVLLAGTRSRRYLGRRHGRSFIRPSLRYAGERWCRVKETMLSTVSSGPVLGPLLRPPCRDEESSMSRPRARPFFYSSVAPICCCERAEPCEGNGARHRLPGPALRSAPAFASPKTAPVVVDFAK